MNRRLLFYVLPLAAVLCFFSCCVGSEKVESISETELFTIKYGSFENDTLNTVNFDINHYYQSLYEVSFETLDNIEDADIICKVLVKLPPYMSAFEVGTSFFNPKSLTENHYLTFGHNTIEYLKNYPFITVKAVAAE